MVKNWACQFHNIMHGYAPPPPQLQRSWFMHGVPNFEEAEGAYWFGPVCPPPAIFFFLLLDVDS